MSLWILLMVAIFSVFGMALMLFVTKKNSSSNNSSVDTLQEKTFKRDELS
ncbi:hypothetical protein [Paenisporosarcina sp. TG20]|nr:hypothetical protein [Paenisporosarcina sp. TG20]